MDDLLYDECDDAVYREMQRRGMAHLADVWPFDEIVRRAMDCVIECAWDPARAAEWAVDLEIEMQEEGLGRWRRGCRGEGGVAGTRKSSGRWRGASESTS